MVERIEVPVPEGFPPMCEPVQAERREDNVVVTPAQEKHLAAMAASFEDSYPKAILDSITTSPETRYATHTVERFSAYIKAPDVVMLVASLGNDGPFMGCACYLRPSQNKHLMHIFRPSAFRQGHNFQRLMGWTDKQVDEMHSDLKTDLLEAIMVHQQQQREKLMGSHPYIMLGPIWVSREYRSRGVASKLVERGFAMAIEGRVPLLLSGVFPNAAPAYLHLGFEILEGYDDLMLWWPIGIPRGKVVGGKLTY